MNTPEHDRLEAARTGAAPWKAWGPYLSERQWGTVREDYSRGGDAWNYFPHDHARSRAYRWGEDGIAGVSDDEQRLCLALALWNGADPILKERMFGLTNAEGNHGEDVKEYWFYVDSTPTHSYMKCLYKYPQAAYPYDDLLRTNAARGFGDLEYELLDTGIFDDDRYFDVERRVREGRARRHADARHRAQPRAGGGDAAPAADALVPQHVARRVGAAVDRGGRGRRARARTRQLGEWRFEADGELLFCDNETNARRFGEADGAPYPKDAINDHVVAARRLGQPGTHRDEGRRAPRARDPGGRVGGGPGAAARAAAAAVDFDAVFAERIAEADAFYAGVIPDHARRGRDATSCARRWPGCCGASSTTSTTSTAGCASRASTRGGRTRRAAGCATSPGSTSSPAT